ncbi:MAG: hypothetical protein LBG15_11350 [Dysgonamonadaceae bacterium]|jgi:hypothetical protein|nr:hypothetical protein [Dysgonamonadaceae bacterium]
MKNNLMKTVGFSLIIPVYNQHEIKKQVLKKERQLSDILLANNQLYKDVYFEIEKLCQEVRQSRKNIQHNFVQ